MRFPTSIYVGLATGLASMAASACTCPVWSPAEYAAQSDVIVLATVRSVGKAQKTDKANTEMTFAEVLYPVILEVSEVMKGEATTKLDILTIGPPSSCELALQPGSQIALMLRKTQKMVGYCDAVSSPKWIDELRVATKKASASP